MLDYILDPTLSFFFIGVASTAAFFALMLIVMAIINGKPYNKYTVGAIIGLLAITAGSLAVFVIAQATNR